MKSDIKYKCGRCEHETVNISSMFELKLCSSCVVYLYEQEYYSKHFGVNLIDKDDEEWVKLGDNEL